MEYHSIKEYNRLVTDIPKDKLDIHKKELADFLLNLPMPAKSSVNDFKDDYANKKPVQKSKPEEKLSKEKQRLLEAFDALPNDSRRVVLKLVENFAAKISESKKI